MDKWLYSEAQLAKHLGMPRTAIMKVRSSTLRKNADWNLRDNEVALSLRGLAKLLQALEIPAGRVDVTACYFPQKNSAPAVLLLCDRGQVPPPVKMKVRRIFPNPRLVEAVEVDRPNQLQRVLVKTNENLTIGMHFECIPDVGNPGYWKLAGPLPRWRGRW